MWQDGEGVVLRITWRGCIKCGSIGMWYNGGDVVERGRIKVSEVC